MLAMIGRFLTRKFFHSPIFVVGSGRSGTSVLQRALGQHSTILSLDESPFIPYVGYLLHPFEFRDNNDYHRGYLRTSIDYMYARFRTLCFESAIGEHYGLRELVKNPADFVSLVVRTRFWCAKTFPNKVEGAGLVKLYPNAKFLYIYRNGCAVVNSRSHFGQMKQQSFRAHCETWAKHVEKYNYLFDMPEALAVRQEDLLNQPVDVFRRIQSFVGVPYEDALANYTQTTLVHPLDKSTQQEVNAVDTLKARAAPHTTWSREQKEIFKDICGDGMQKLGYEIPF